MLRGVCRGWSRRPGLRSLTVRACTGQRFTELLRRDEYTPETIGSGPECEGEFAWYESDNCMGCVVDAKSGNGDSPADYCCFIFDKASDAVMPQWRDMIPGISNGILDVDQASARLVQRLQELEMTSPSSPAERS